MKVTIFHSPRLKSHCHFASVRRECDRQGIQFIVCVLHLVVKITTVVS